MKDNTLEFIYKLCMLGLVCILGWKCIYLGNRISELEKKVMIDEIAFATWTHMCK